MTHWVAEHFQKLQFILLCAVGVIAWLSTRERSQSQFKVREADRADLDRILKGEASLADARLKKNTPPPPPLSLPGIRLHGEPHEILGISPHASDAEIMKAYKDAIKQFHPDRIQGPAQENMKFYQEAATQLNWAKDQLLNKKK